MPKPLPAARILPCGTPLSQWAEERRAHLDGRPVVVSVSGGKDSTATCLLLQEAEIPYQAVHMDTGWESETTERYVRDYLPGVVGPIEIVKSHLGGMLDMIRHRSMFPSRVRRWCTQELKVRPFARWLRALDDEPVNAIGVRRAESRARSELEEWDQNARFDCEVWRPLYLWTYQDVVDIHQAHGVQPNPLYLQGSSRVGCWPCVLSRKDEIRLIADQDPGRIDMLEALEAEITQSQRALGRIEPDQVAGFFRDPKRVYGSVGVREVVDWSRTSRGGRQTELFTPDYAAEGCMRWGMCDHGSPDAP